MVLASGFTIIFIGGADRAAEQRHSQNGKPFQSTTGWSPARMASAFHQLMLRLGYTRYVAQGAEADATMDTHRLPYRTRRSVWWSAPDGAGSWWIELAARPVFAFLRVMSMRIGAIRALG